MKLTIRLTVSRWGDDESPPGHGLRVLDESGSGMCAHWRRRIFGRVDPELGTYEVTGTVRKVVERPKRKARKKGKVR